MSDVRLPGTTLVPLSQYQSEFLLVTALSRRMLYGEIAVACGGVWGP